MNMSERSNAVRQVLMNDVGLTREYIRGQVADIVQSTLQAQLQRSGYLEQLVASVVKSHIEQALRTPSYSTESPLTAMTRTALEAECKRVIRDAVQITVKPVVTKP